MAGAFLGVPNQLQEEKEEASNQPLFSSYGVVFFVVLWTQLPWPMPFGLRKEEEGNALCSEWRMVFSFLVCISE
jgi:hypothetical protein